MFWKMRSSSCVTHGLFSNVTNLGKKIKLTHYWHPRMPLPQLKPKNISYRDKKKTQKVKHLPPRQPTITWCPQNIPLVCMHTTVEPGGNPGVSPQVLSTSFIFSDIFSHWPRTYQLPKFAGQQAYPEPTYLCLPSTQITLICHQGQVWFLPFIPSFFLFCGFWELDSHLHASKSSNL